MANRYDFNKIDGFLLFLEQCFSVLNTKATEYCLTKNNQKMIEIERCFTSINQIVTTMNELYHPALFMDRLSQLISIFNANFGDKNGRNYICSFPHMKHNF